MEYDIILMLRIGLGATFVLAGIFILKDKNRWIDMIRPQLRGLLPDSFWRKNMTGNGLFDVVVGVWMFTPWFTWLAAGLAALHLLMVLFASGINRETFRDIGLLAASMALFFLTFN